MVITEQNLKHLDIGYEMWKQGYALEDCSPSGQIKAYQLCVDLYEQGKIKTVDDFIQWMFVNEPEMLYDQEAEERRYREENEPKIREYFAKYIQGRTFDKIDPNDWDFYSDWHKDVFGYRPHGIVCGEYVNPHQ
jgi:hypothetical protein